MYFEFILNIVFIFFLGRAMYYYSKAIKSKDKANIKVQSLLFGITLVVILLIKFWIYP